MLKKIGLVLIIALLASMSFGCKEEPSCNSLQDAFGDNKLWAFKWDNGTAVGPGTLLYDGSAWVGLASHPWTGNQACLAVLPDSVDAGSNSYTLNPSGNWDSDIVGMEADAREWFLAQAEAQGVDTGNFFVSWCGGGKCMLLEADEWLVF